MFLHLGMLSAHNQKGSGRSPPGLQTFDSKWRHDRAGWAAWLMPLRSALKTGKSCELYRLYKKIAKATKAAVMIQRMMFLLLLLFSSAIVEVQHICK